MKETKIKQYVLPLPPSVNGYWTRGRKRDGTPNMRRTDAARKWNVRATEAILKQGRVEFGQVPVQVTVQLYPRPQGGDADNYSKGLLDGLASNRVFDNDDQVLMIDVRKHATTPEGLAVVRIRALEADEIEILSQGPFPEHLEELGRIG